MTPEEKVLEKAKAAFEELKTTTLVYNIVQSEDMIDNIRKALVPGTISEQELEEATNSGRVRYARSAFERLQTSTAPVKPYTVLMNIYDALKAAKEGISVLMPHVEEEFIKERLKAGVVRMQGIYDTHRANEEATLRLRSELNRFDRFSSSRFGQFNTDYDNAKSLYFNIFAATPNERFEHRLREAKLSAEAEVQLIHKLRIAELGAEALVEKIFGDPAKGEAAHQQLKVLREEMLREIEKAKPSIRKLRLEPKGQ